MNSKTLAFVRMEPHEDLSFLKGYADLGVTLYADQPVCDKLAELGIPAQRYVPSFHAITTEEAIVSMPAETLLVISFDGCHTLDQLRDRQMFERFGTTRGVPRVVLADGVWMVEM